jgi:hypothetical protein
MSFDYLFCMIYINRVMLDIIILFSFYLLKIDVVLKIIIESKLIVIYHKFNSNFKRHINFGDKG